MDKDLWENQVDQAQAMAANGQPVPALEHLLQACRRGKAANRLTYVFKFACTLGLQDHVLEEAEGILRELADNWRGNTQVVTQLFRVFHLCGRYQHLETLFNLANRDNDVWEIPLFSQVAQALMDLDLLENPNAAGFLVPLFRKSVLQQLPDGRNRPHELLAKLAQQSVTAPWLNTRILSHHRSLFDRAFGEYPPQRKGPFLIAILLGQPLEVPHKRLIRLLNECRARDLCAVFSREPGKLVPIIVALVGDRPLSKGFRGLAPRTVMVLDKLQVGMRDSGIKLVVETWLRQRDWEQPPASTSALDPLVIRYRALIPGGAKRYLDQRSATADLRSLGLYQPIRPELPNLQTSRRLRIAFCVSGQLRGYGKAFQSIRDHLFRDIEPVIFLHVWRKIGRKAPLPPQAWRMFGGEFLKAYQQVASSIGFPAMKQRYPRVTGLDDEQAVTIEDLTRTYGCPPEQVVIEDDSAEPFRNFRNPEKMYYKIEACHRLAMASGGTFDGIFRIRPDKSIYGRHAQFSWDHMLDASARLPALFADQGIWLHKTSGLVIGDQAAFGVPAIMERYAASPHLTREASEFRWHDWPDAPVAHRNLSHTMWVSGIGVHSFPLAWGPLLDPERISPQAVLARLEADLADRSLNQKDEHLLKAARSDVVTA